MRKKVFTTLVALSCAVGGVSATVAGTAESASALIGCFASQSSIYTSPTSITAPNGTLLACRSVSLTGIPNNIPMNAYLVQYASTDANGVRIAVSGTVAVPKAAWTGPGTRPVVAYNPGTLGIGSQCAFSKQLNGAYQDEFEGDGLSDLLKDGIAIAATDGVGYVNGQVHPYVVGADAGHALLDVAKSAFQIPFGGLNPGTKVGLWGYSEGGQASLWASQLAASYAPSLNVAGAAAGGVPGDLKLTATNLNGSAFFGFLGDAVIGVLATHPSFPVNSLINATGAKAIAQLKTVCTIGTLAAVAFQKIESYTTRGLSLAQLYTVADPSGYTVGQFLDASKLGVGIGTPGSGAQYTINFPTYQYRGMFDEVIPQASEDATAQAYCAAGITTKYKKDYFGDHAITEGSAAPDAVSWLNDRFHGVAAPSTC